MSPSLSWIDSKVWSGLLDESGLIHGAVAEEPVASRRFLPPPGPMEERLAYLRQWLSGCCSVEGFLVADESGLPLTGSGDSQEALVVFNLLKTLHEIRRQGKRALQGTSVFLQEGGCLYLFEADLPAGRYGLILTTPHEFGRQEMEAIHRAFMATLT